jgi:thioredoxin 1
MTDASILVLTDDTFDTEVQKVREPVLVDFWADWCVPCKRLAPTLEELSLEMAGRIRIAKVNVEDNGDLANRFGIRSIPTMVVFKAGRIVDQIVGNQPKDSIRRILEKHLSSPPAV